MIASFNFLKLRQAVELISESVMRAVIVAFCATAIVLKLVGGGSRAPAYLLAHLAALATIYLTWKWRDQLSEVAWRKAGKYTLAVFAVVSIGWAIAFSAPQITDNAVLWRCGTEYKGPVSRWFDACRPEFFDLSAIYAQRSFFYTLPFGRLFGANYPLFKLYNAILHILTAGLLYMALLKWFGTRAAVAGLLVLVLHVEWTYHIQIASRDNVGIIAITACVIAIAAFARDGFHLGALLALAVTLLFADWSRTIGLFCVLTAAVAILIGPGEDAIAKRIAKVAAVCVSYVAIGWLMKSLIGFSVSNDSFAKLFGSFETLVPPAQNPVNYLEWHDHLWPAIALEHRTAIAMQRFWEELAVNYLNLLPCYVDKISQLSSGSLALLFDIPPEISPHVVYTATANTSPRGAVIDGLSASLPVFLLTLLGAAAFQIRRLTLIALVALCFIAGVLSVLLAFFSVMPYYMLSVAPALSILVAAFCKDLSRDQLWAPVPAKRTAVGFGILVGLWGLGLAASVVAGPSPARLLMQMAQEKPAAVPEFACNGRQIPVWPYFGRRMRPHLEPDVECVSFRVPLDPWGKRISFFITREAFPLPPAKLPPVAFEYAMRIGNEPLEFRTLANETARWHTMKVPSIVGVAPTLQLVVRRTHKEVVVEFEIRDLIIQR